MPDVTVESRAHSIDPDRVAHAQARLSSADALRVTTTPPSGTTNARRNT